MLCSRMHLKISVLFYNKIKEMFSAIDKNTRGDKRRKMDKRDQIRVSDYCLSPRMIPLPPLLLLGGSRLACEAA